MKLRNKKTGEIVDFAKGNFISSKDYGFVVYRDGGRGIEYNSLAELNSEWEDVPEEPKDNKYWYIDDLGRIHFSSEVIDEVEGHPNNWMIRKQFNNYFSSWYEAEKAVEKLKAWKRLKDKGFEFRGWKFEGITPDMKHNLLNIKVEIPYTLENMKDLDLLFSGGEE